MLYTNSKKGISILFAILILSVVLSIGLGISYISIQQIKTTREIGYSTVAFFAADTGIENVLYEDKLCRPPSCSTSTPLSFCNPDCTGLKNGYSTSSFLENNASYFATFSSDTVSTIRSIGSYKTTKRAIEVSR